MKRFFCVGLAALLLWVGCMALADVEFDFSGMTLEELYAARDALDQAIAGLEQADTAREYGPGVYEVGKDIPEGDYLISEAPNAAFAAVYVRAGGEDAAPLLLQKIVTGECILHLARETFLTMSETVAVPLSQAQEANLAEGPVGPGAFAVGRQLPAGRYVIDLDGKSQVHRYAVYSGIPGTDSTMIEMNFVHQPLEIELDEGEYIELSGCVLRLPD